jgi:hypothetical protein
MPLGATRVAVVLSLALATGCEAGAAFPVPPGPPRAVAVRVSLPVYVLGTWAVQSFTDDLRVELEKYRIEIVDAKRRPEAAEFEVNLGQFTYASWQTIDVSAVVSGAPVSIGAVHVSDLGGATVEAVAEPVAVIIARRVWGAAGASASRSRGLL